MPTKRVKQQVIRLLIGVRRHTLYEKGGVTNGEETACATTVGARYM